MTQAQVSYTDSCPLVLRYPVAGSLESVRVSSDVRDRLIVEFTNNGVAGVKFREDEEEGWTPVSRRRSRRQKMGPGRTSGDPVDRCKIALSGGSKTRIRKSARGFIPLCRQCSRPFNWVPLSPTGGVWHKSSKARDHSRHAWWPIATYRPWYHIMSNLN